MPTTERHTVPETNGPKPVTLAELQRSREIVAPGPSGHHFKIRPLLIDDYLLKGGLPTRLVTAAREGMPRLNEEIAAMIAEGGGEEKDTEAREFLVGIIRTLVIEPDLSGVDPTQALLPVDFKWLAAVALMHTDLDGEGRRLWGREPLSTFRAFREEHGCSQDCESCHRVADAFSAPLL